MRIVYDDTMSKEAIRLLENAMRNIDGGIEKYTRYEYGMQRVQRDAVKRRINEVFADCNLKIGNTVTHANGIGNNCMYPIYFYGKSETQHCCNININSDMYGCLYVCLENYDGWVIGSKYEITRNGVHKNGNSRFIRAEED